MHMEKQESLSNGEKEGTEGTGNIVISRLKRMEINNSAS